MSVSGLGRGIALLPSVVYQQICSNYISICNIPSCNIPSCNIPFISPDSH